jgi:hypothetical protein
VQRMRAIAVRLVTERVIRHTCGPSRRARPF